MEEKKPIIQHAIKMVQFFVTNLELSTSPFVQTEQSQISAEIDHSVGFIENSKEYIVRFNVMLSNVENDEPENDEPENDDIEGDEIDPSHFSLNMHAFAVFASKEEIDDDFKTSDLALINSPAIAFPFVRSYVNTISSNSGMPPIILPSYNFSAPQDTD